ncbi:MAG: hypothetical protein JWP04_3919, partial [Belnapia sp.]|nr:hypothetical protein [Belnapia sp.]
VDVLVQWLLRARFDWQPAPDPAETAGRLGRALFAALTHQAAATGQRLRPETLATLRDWIGLAGRREDGPAALTEPDAIPISAVTADITDP